MSKNEITDIQEPVNENIENINDEKPVVETKDAETNDSEEPVVETEEPVVETKDAETKDTEEPVVETEDA